MESIDSPEISDGGGGGGIRHPWPSLLGPENDDSVMTSDEKDQKMHGGHSY